MRFNTISTQTESRSDVDLLVSMCECVCLCECVRNNVIDGTRASGTTEAHVSQS